jgi:hypothetical protein
VLTNHLSLIHTYKKKPVIPAWTAGIQIIRM